MAAWLIKLLGHHMEHFCIKQIRKFGYLLGFKDPLKSLSLELQYSMERVDYRRTIVMLDK